MDNPYEAPQTTSPATRSEPGARDLPKWIRFFSWIFLVVGPLMLVSAAVAEFVGGQAMSYDFLGVKAYGRLTDPGVLFVLALFMFNAAAAFGLLFRKDWGLDVGLAAGLIGLLISSLSLFSVFSGPSGTSVHYRFEPIFQIAFLVVLFRRRAQWRGGV